MQGKGVSSRYGCLRKDKGLVHLNVFLIMFFFLHHFIARLQREEFQTVNCVRTYTFLSSNFCDDDDDVDYIMMMTTL